MKILAINPGSTSTKIAVYDDLKEHFSTTLRHESEELSMYPRIIDQYDFRIKIIAETLEKNCVPVASLDAVVGRGGLVKPIPGGVYTVNDLMIEDIRKKRTRKASMPQTWAQYWHGRYLTNLGATSRLSLSIR